MKRLGFSKIKGGVFTLSIFDKFKQGVSEAGQKAKIAVEVNRLKLQVSSKQAIIKEKYALIGEQVFLLHKEQSPVSDNNIEHLCSEIMAIEQEIKAVQDKIRELTQEKVCQCGTPVEINARFCPSCGSHVDSQAPDVPLVSQENSKKEDQVIEQKTNESVSSEVEVNEQQEFQEQRTCMKCLKRISKLEKFCGYCGQAQE